MPRMRTVLMVAQLFQQAFHGRGSRQQSLARAEIQKPRGAPCAALSGTDQIPQERNGGVIGIEHFGGKHDTGQYDRQLIIQIVRGCGGYRVGLVLFAKTLHNPQ